MSTPVPHIGTLREKPLHRSLKEWYHEPGDRFEVPLQGYVIDIVRGDLLIEIQTGGFSSMRDKVASLLDNGHRMRIVFPVPMEKTIVKISDEGEVIQRRRSPKRGQVTDMFAELVSFPSLVTERDLEIDVLLTKQEELRRHTPGRSWRRKGWSVEERRLIDVVDSVRVADRASLLDLLPDEMPDPFTTAELAEACQQRRRIAQQMAYCMRQAGLIVAVGKSGNAIRYSVVQS